MVTVSGSGIFVLIANVISLLLETTVTNFMTLVLVEVYEPRIMTIITHRLGTAPEEMPIDLPAVVRHDHILTDLHLVAGHVKPYIQPIRNPDRRDSRMLVCEHGYEKLDSFAGFLKIRLRKKMIICFFDAGRYWFIYRYFYICCINACAEYSYHPETCREVRL